MRARFLDKSGVPKGDELLLLELEVWQSARGNLVVPLRLCCREATNDSERIQPEAIAAGVHGGVNC